MKTHIKNELGHKYGMLIVVAYTDKREPSNGCVKWECECLNCGAHTIRNGNRLRFSKRAKCKVCSKRR